MKRNQQSQIGYLLCAIAASSSAAACSGLMQMTVQSSASACIACNNRCLCVSLASGRRRRQMSHTSRWRRSRCQWTIGSTCISMMVCSSSTLMKVRTSDLLGRCKSYRTSFIEVGCVWLAMPTASLLTRWRKFCSQWVCQISRPRQSRRQRSQRMTHGLTCLGW